MAAMPELVSHGEAGLLCGRGDEGCFVSSIKRLLDDPALRQTMGHAARRHVEERFNPDRCYPRLFELFAVVVTVDEGAAGIGARSRLLLSARGASRVSASRSGGGVSLMPHPALLGNAVLADHSGQGRPESAGSNGRRTCAGRVGEETESLPRRRDPPRRPHRGSLLQDRRQVPARRAAPTDPRLITRGASWRFVVGRRPRLVSGSFESRRLAEGAP
jgi:hypothetical protein